MTWVVDNAEFVALLVTIVLAFTGYFVTHVLSTRRQRAEARFDFVAAQLEKLYGPLFSLVEANTASWNAFRNTFRPNEPMYDRPFTDDEKQVWAAWADNVFIPSNLKIRDVIENNAHLLVDGEMPDSFRRVLAHIESSKIVMPALAAGGLHILGEFEDWPAEFNGFVKASYEAISREHARLLGQSRGADIARRVRKDVRNRVSKALSKSTPTPTSSH